MEKTKSHSVMECYKADARIAELETRLKDAEGEMLLMHVELAAKRAFKAELETRATTAEADAARLRSAANRVLEKAKKRAVGGSLNKHLEGFHFIEIHLDAADIAALRAERQDSQDE